MRHPASAPQLLGLVIAIGVVLVAGPAAAQTAAPKPAPPKAASPKVASVKAAIEAANARFAADFAKGDATAVASHYTAGGQAFPPNGDVAKGREAIAKLWKGAMDAGVKSVKLVVVEVEGHGDTANEVGTYALFGEGGKSIDSGKYIVIWKRDGGQWRIHRDIWNTSMPATK